MIAGDIEIRLFAQIARLQRDMDQARQVVTSATNGMARAADMAKTALAGIGIGAGLSQVIQMSDQYAKFTAQLRLATQSTREYAQAYADVKRISTSAQADLNATGTLYARIANGTRELGISQQKVADITESVNMALKVSGATTQESASAILQLSQAFGAGALRGEEFNAVNEAAPRLMKALADGMGVPIGALKDMASNGLITSKVMAEVLPQALGKLREESKEVQTIAGALQVLKNNVLEFTATSAQSNGTVSALTSGIGLLADNLRIVAGAVLTVTAVKFGTWLASSAQQAMASMNANRALAASNLATAEANATATASASLLANARLAEVRAATLAAAGNVQLAITTNGLIPAQARAAVAAEAHTVAMGALTVAQRAASASTTAMSVVMGALGGPVGAIITILGIAATAWSWYGSKAEEANRQAAASADVTTPEIIANIEKQNEKLRERIQLAKKAGQSDLAKEGGPEAERMASTLKRINELKAQGKSISLVDQVELITIQGLYDDLAKATGANKGLKAELSTTGAEATALIGVRERLAGVNKQYLDDLKSLEAARAVGAIGEKEYISLVTQLATEEYKKSNIGKDSLAAANKEKEAYASLISGIKEKIDQNRIELAIGESATESQKAQIKLDQELASGKLKLAPAHKALTEAKLAELAVTERALKLQESQRDVTKYIAASTQARDESSAALTVELALYGKSVDARAIEMVAVKAQADAEKKLNELREKHLPITDQILNQLSAEQKARVLVEQATLGQTKALQYASQLAEENKRFGLEYIMDDKARAAASLVIDDKMWQERIRLAGEGTDAQKILQNEYTVWYQNQAIKPQLDEQKKMWQSVEQTAHDTFISIFDSGKSAFNRLRDALKNGLLDLLYQMTLKKWIFNIGASVGMGGVSGVAQAAAGGASGAGNALGMAGNAYSLISGGMSLAGGLGTGFMGSLAGGLNGAGIGSGLTSATGLAMGESIAGVVGSSVAGAMSTGLAAMAAAAPYVAAIVAAVALVKTLDHSGTPHIGGAASASSAGVSTIAAESLHFEKTQTSADAEKMTAQLASGIVGILDSTALAFGKTAGYTAATAFADDSSKDGAWGGLVISKLGQTLVDWQDSRGNGPWAPKVFADGAEGQKQYLAAISGDVRTALDGIGLPDWAQKMLDGLGKDAGLEDMAKTVDAINSTQKALKSMGDTLVGFSDLSEGAVSALMAAAGGIQNLAAGASAYYDNFYGDYEKNASTIKQIGDALSAVGLTAPATREEFRALVEAQMALGEAGAPTVAALFKVAGAFAQVHPAIDATTAALGDQAQAAADAEEAIRKAQESAAAATKSMGDAFLGAMNGATEAAKALRDFNDSLKLGNLSPLSKDAQYAVAKQAYLASPSDQSAANAFLGASKDHGSKLDYARDFAMVIDANAKAAAEKDSIAAAIPRMWAAFNSVDGSHANGLDYVPFNNYRANLHEGEGVLTATENKRYRASTGGGMTEATARELIAVLNRIDSNTEGTEKHVRATSNTLTQVSKGGKAFQTTAA